MGRRSINTTKSGKFMNPTDQARKEARKKELKKNKKQRQMVRTAVLKGKDPNQLMDELEKIDQMEYDVNNPPQLNEKVLKDKRKKLRETFQRILKLYEKEDREQYIELKKLEQDYEVKRNKMIQYFESVKHAEQVKLEEIPLPLIPGELPANNTSQIPLPGEIPLPSGPASQPQSILKRSSVSGEIRSKCGKLPPGVPPGPPPPLFSDDEDSDAETPMDVDKPNVKSKKIRFEDEGEHDGDDGSRLKAKRMAATGQDINEFLKEMEVVHKQKAEESGENTDFKDKPDELATGASMKSIAPPLPLNNTQMPPGPPPHMMFSRPPPPGVRPPGIPPRPPPRMLPPGPPPGLPPIRMGGPPLRLPPGPPPGLPPRLMRPPGMPPPVPSSSQPSQVNPNVLSAPPSLISRKSKSVGGAINQSEADDRKSSGATIEAKPQLRNLSADVTKFMPTSLRIKREERTIRKRELMPLSLGLLHGEELSGMAIKSRQLTSLVKGPSKDETYDLFMKEMEGFL